MSPKGRLGSVYEHIRLADRWDPSVSRNPGQLKEFFEISETFGHLISYSDKRAQWEKKEPIFCVELSTF